MRLALEFLIERIYGFDGVLLIVLLMISVVPLALSLMTKRLRLLEPPPMEFNACLLRWLLLEKALPLLIESPTIVLVSVDLIGFSFPPSCTKLLLTLLDLRFTCPNLSSSLRLNFWPVIFADSSVLNSSLKSIFSSSKVWPRSFCLLFSVKSL